MIEANKKNYLFLGFAIPDKIMEDTFSKDKLPSIQTHKFNWNFIKGIEHQNKHMFTYISARPVMDYPYFPQKLFCKHKWLVTINNKTIKVLEIPFINVGILKLLTRFLSAFYFGTKNFRKKKNKAGVLVYSVHVPYMLAAYIISKIYKIDMICIWTDPPSIITSKESKLKSKLRSIEYKFSNFLMKKTSKVIAVTKHLAEDFAPEKPYLVLEGIIDHVEDNHPATVNSVSNSFYTRIIYTGSLEKRYGIKNIVDGFLLLGNKKAVLEIYGRGDFEAELLDVSKQNPNVIYHGYVLHSEIINIQRNADFLINARSDDDDYVKYSFPSKTLEYMLSGTPLITTMLSGIPHEYKDYLIVLENNDPKTICEKLNSIMNMNHEERYLLGSKAKKFAYNKNYIVQGNRIINFLES